MSDSSNLQHPGSLWQRTIEQTNHALACGALFSIPTTYEFIEQDGVQFLVRIVMNLARKETAKQQQKQAKIEMGKDFNPFLPYEADLFVRDLSDTHVCILNKYNVVDHHLLIITRAFEEQEALLTLQDFEALSACFAEIDGLAFYNGGKTAGASQRHKHLQLVPLPLVPEVRLPIEPLFQSIETPAIVTKTPELPFVHALIRFDPQDIKSPTRMLHYYQKLLQAVGMSTNQVMQSAPYNLLATQNWMFVVPRSQEKFASISINSLGFAGALLVRNLEQRERLRQLQPMNLLKNVAIAIPSE
jgi:ATP adenylyltransferase